MVRLLLSRGANINACDKRDRRAIHWAAYMGEKRLGESFTFFHILLAPAVELVFIALKILAVLFICTLGSIAHETRDAYKKILWVN